MIDLPTHNLTIFKKRKYIIENVDRLWDPSHFVSFSGNISLERLKESLDRFGEDVVARSLGKSLLDQLEGAEYDEIEYEDPIDPSGYW